MVRMLSNVLSLVWIAQVALAGNPKSPVASVNGVPITEAQLAEEVNRRLPLGSFHAGVSEEKYNEIRRQALDKLVDDELLYQEAKKRGLSVDPQQVRKRVDLMKSAYATEQAFEEHLKKAGLSYKEWVKRIERRLLITRLLREVEKEVTVSDADVRQYYEKNREKFVIPEQLKLRHILISVPPGASGDGWQKGLEKALQVRDRIRSGADFAKVAREVSDDTTSADKGGDLGWVHVGQLIPELDAVAKKLEVGEVSDPVLSIYGFHILKLEGRRPSKQLTFEEIDREGLRRKLLKKRIEERRKAFLDSLRSAAKIKLPDWYGS